MILVSNDDGIDSEGIVLLAEALTAIDDVVVVAPDRERSAASHSLTLHRPLRARETAPGWWQVDGTPVDCVNLAVHGLLESKPDLVVSGVNRGPNLGDDVFYSGTVAAAIEGTLLGIPSIAVSLAALDSFRFETAVSFAKALAEAVLSRGLPSRTLVNVNVPAAREGQVAGFRATRLGRRRYEDAVVERVDPRGGTYYWIGGGELAGEAKAGTDFEAIVRGFVSLTPLDLDLTHDDHLESLEALGIQWP